MKGMQQISCLRNIKGIHSAGLRSIPKVQRSGFLDLYVLKREKGRVEKELFALEKRRTAADRELNSIATRVERLQRETHEEQKVKTHRNVSGRSVKAMAIHY